MGVGKTDWKPGNVTKGYRDGYDAMKWGNASKEPCCSDDDCPPKDMCCEPCCKDGVTRACCQGDLMEPCCSDDECCEPCCNTEGESPCLCSKV